MVCHHSPVSPVLRQYGLPPQSCVEAVWSATTVQCWSATTVLVSPVLAGQYGLPPQSSGGAVLFVIAVLVSPVLRQYGLPPQSSAGTVWSAIAVLVSPVLRQYDLPPQSLSVQCWGSMVCHSSLGQSNLNTVIKYVCYFIYSDVQLELMHIYYNECDVIKVPNQHTRELISTRNTSTKQRHESATVTLTWHACKYKVHKLHQRYISKGTERYQTNFVPNETRFYSAKVFH